MANRTSDLLALLLVCCFAFAVQKVESKGNMTSHPIDNPKEWFYKTAGPACEKAVREDDRNCTAKYLDKYNIDKNQDLKGYCCYYHEMYRCLDAAIKAKCDLAIYKNFKADRIFGAITEAIIYHDCPKYPDYESCKFPLVKVLLLSGAALLVVLLVVGAVVYKFVRTGFHKVSTAEV